MPILWPEDPALVNASERKVWTQLRDELGDDDLLIANLRITDHSQDFEIDIAVVLPGAAIVVVEVKGSGAYHNGYGWRQALSDGVERDIDPVGQARDAKYALRSYLEGDARWGSRSGCRWGHAVVLPYLSIADDFDLPDCPRWAVAGRTDLSTLGARLRRIGLDQTSTDRPVTHDDVRVLLDILRGRSLPQRDLVSSRAERSDVADRLTEEQAIVLRAIRLLPRVEVRGGAGSGKTWLAIEQARRLAADGKRVALLCYSRGLAAFLTRRVETFDKRRHAPAYVGTFHGLGDAWGASPGRDDDSDYWERRLPEQMLELAAQLPDGRKFDAVVVDEAQDFADAWWPALMACLKDEETGGVYTFSDEGQRIFLREGGTPLQLVPIVLDQNLRNSRQIGETFSSLAPMRMRLLGGDGPRVRLVECAPDKALDCADDEVETLMDAGWLPKDIALLATGSRHPEQVSRQGEGHARYWESFWDDDQVFYGHVLGFKGLERQAVVLAVNEAEPSERSRERLYVGLSRARDQLVVCGDPGFIEGVAGAEVLRKLRG